MKALQAYVDQHNSWSAIVGGKTWVIGRDNQAIADSIDCDLSPENLSCDGELSVAQVRQRYTKLTAAARDLVKLDPTVTFREYA